MERAWNTEVGTNTNLRDFPMYGTAPTLTAMCDMVLDLKDLRHMKAIKQCQAATITSSTQVLPLGDHVLSQNGNFLSIQPFNMYVYENISLVAYYLCTYLTT